VFILFGSARCYYARGGWNDFLSAFDDLTAAIAAARSWRVREDWMSDEEFSAANVIEWWHIVDAASGKIVAGSRSQPYGAEDLNKELQA